MLLVADIGNTNITVGLLDKRDLKASWRLNSRIMRTEDEIWILLKMLLDSGGFSWAQVDGMALGSVVPSLTPPAREPAVVLPRSRPPAAAHEVLAAPGTACGIGAG